MTTYTPDQITALTQHLTAAELAELNALVAAPVKVDYTIYQNDPVGYCRIVLGLFLTPEQETILNSVRDNRRTAVLASHSIGKTFIAACAICWWYDCWNAHLVYLTAPTWSQALTLCFAQVKLLRLKHNLPGIVLESGRVNDPDPLKEPAHYIACKNCANAESFQGQHLAPLLIVLDEAVGIPSFIWLALEGLMTLKANRVLAIANPTSDNNNFGRICKDKAWVKHSVSALSHPNIALELAGLDPIIPGAISLMWLEEAIARDCEPALVLEGDNFEFPPGSGLFHEPDSWFMGRVLGQFPSNSEESIIPSGWLANTPVITPVPNDIVQIGCDPARNGGDRSAIVGRYGTAVFLCREYKLYDVDRTAGAAMIAAIDLANLINTIFADDPEHIPIRAKDIAISTDVTGGLGVGVCSHMRIAGQKVVEVNSSSAAYQPRLYPNQRSALWFSTREIARCKELDMSRLPADMRSTLTSELASPRWTSDSKGRKVAEPKAETKKRLLGASPDLADALNLAFLRPPKKGIVKRKSPYGPHHAGFS